MSPPIDEQEKLPTWREFRPRYPDEDDVAYRLNRLEYDLRQERDRDHWIVGQFQAVLGQVELLHQDLVGDGSPLRVGVLNQLLEGQRGLVSEQRRTPSLIADAIAQANITRQATSWSSTQRWLWGLLGTCTAALLTGLIYLLINHPH